MIVWPVTSSRKMTAKRSTALTVGDQFQTTLSGVNTISARSTITWNRKQPRPGPRSASRTSPL